MTSEITLICHLHGPLCKLGEKITLQLPQGISVYETLAHFSLLYPDFVPWQNSTRCALNLDYLPSNFKFRQNSEIHLIPPVSGG